jgi:N-methylhydantoinase B
MPVEATENVSPVVFWRKELRPDSGGAGRTRGGCGQVMEVATKGDLEFAVNATFDRVLHPPKGRDGGGDGAPGRVTLKSGKVLRPKGFQIIPDGDRLILEMAGGGGMGDPAGRDPEKVARDVRDGLVSAEAAQVVYGKVTICGEKRPRGAMAQDMNDEVGRERPCK